MITELFRRASWWSAKSVSSSPSMSPTHPHTGSSNRYSVELIASVGHAVAQAVVVDAQYLSIGEPSANDSNFIE